MFEVKWFELKCWLLVLCLGKVGDLVWGGCVIKFFVKFFMFVLYVSCKIICMLYEYIVEFIKWVIIELVEKCFEQWLGFIVWCVVIFVVVVCVLMLIIVRLVCIYFVQCVEME